jgi:hypothetical protein
VAPVPDRVALVFDALVTTILPIAVVVPPEIEFTVKVAFAVV